MIFEDAIVSLLVIDGQVRHLFCLRSVPLGLARLPSTLWSASARIKGESHREAGKSYEDQSEVKKFSSSHGAPLELQEFLR